MKNTPDGLDLLAMTGSMTLPSGFLRSETSRCRTPARKTRMISNHDPQDYLDPRATTGLSVSSGAMRKVLLRGAELLENRDITGTPTKAEPTSTGMAAMKRMRNPLEDQDIDQDFCEVRFPFLRNTNVVIDCINSGNDDDDDSDRRNSKHMEEDPMTKKERNKVIDTEDCSRGPLSGCIRLADSSRVIQRLKVS